MPGPTSPSYNLPPSASTLEGDPVPPPPRRVSATSTRILGGLGKTFISTGVLILLFVAYQLWGTGIQEAQAQDSLRSDFAEVLANAEELVPTTATPSPLTTAAPFIIGEEPSEPVELSDTVDDDPSEAEIPREWLALLFPEGGEEVASIEIPSIEVDKIVVEGVQVADLRKGPGRYSSTAVPGESGNAAIAGHRTTYGAPFHNIDQLVPGDEIIVTNILGRFTYEVIAQPVQNRIGFCEGFVPGDQAENGLDGEGEFGHFIVDPSDTCVLDDWGDDRLTLTACHPKFSARERIVVTAQLVGDPVDAPPRPIPAVDPGEGLGVDEVVDPAEAAGNPGDAVGADPTTGEVVETPTSDVVDRSAAGAFEPEDLDEGLGWDYSALQPAIIWMVAALSVWLLVALVGARWRKWPAYALGIVPFAVLLFTSFEQIDRLLPAY